jgi:RNA polymerase sigma-70 factor (ECF subfamily)
MQRQRALQLDFSTLDDAALLEIIAAAYGKRSSDPALNAAVSMLYDRYARLVYTIALHVVGDGETAEEITQDVFVRACERAHSYRAEIARVGSWLGQIARHRAIDELRRRSARPEGNPLDWPDDVGSEWMDGLPLSDGPEETVETALQQHSIRSLVAALPPEQRLVLGLAFFRGMSHSQIAELLGEPLGTVKSRARLAMQKLRDTMVERGMIEQR